MGSKSFAKVDGAHNKLKKSSVTKGTQSVMETSRSLHQKPLERRSHSTATTEQSYRGTTISTEGNKDRLDNYQMPWTESPVSTSTKMTDYDLRCIGYQVYIAGDPVVDLPSYRATALPELPTTCAYHTRRLDSIDLLQLTRPGLKPMDRYIAESPFEQGSVFIGGGGQMASTGLECSCNVHMDMEAGQTGSVVDNDRHHKPHEFK